MPTHWTYEDVRPDQDLSQGDYLAPTDELREILGKVHRHFCAEKYVGFVIATQTCDLARRAGAECPARYISIAAVRGLYTVLPRLVSSIEGALVRDNVFRFSRKPKAHEFLERLVEQNEQALGLFYFHEDSELGIGDPCVAYLRVTVALKSDHYATLVAARRGRLRPEFQAKFGWLVGNLYARPATIDWAEQDKGLEARNELIQRLLKSKSLQWVDDKALDLATATRNDLEDLSTDDFIAHVRRQRPPLQIDQVVETVATVARRRVETSLAARLKTFEHHVRKLARVRDGDEGAGHGEQAPAAAPLPQAVVDDILAKAREHLCAALTDKESDQLKTDLKSEARLKQLLGK